MEKTYGFGASTKTSPTSLRLVKKDFLAVESYLDTLFFPGRWLVVYR